jgi:CDP-glycerol glycerophosphotransferase
MKNNNNIKEKFKLIKQNVSYSIRLFLHYLFFVFPIQKDKIFIINFNGKGYGDNLKYIVEEIMKRKLKYDIVWSVSNKFRKNFPDSIRLARFNSIRSIYEAVTAKIWIDNTRKQPYVRKRKNQFYIQTWHGQILDTKKVEKDIENKLSSYYIKQAKRDSKLIDIILSDSSVCTEKYKRAFWYNGEIFESGFPKNDILINKPKNITEKVYNYFNLEQGRVKIVLYAPTFRNNFDANIYDLDYESVLNVLRDKTNENWLFLVRLHPNIAEKSTCLNYNNHVLNASLYDDMQELLLVSNILITDYSGAMFDFLLMRKPVFLYVNDYKNYVEERDFYVDLFSLPFPCALNSSVLTEKIALFDHEVYREAVDRLIRQIDVFEDGKASQRVVDRIVEEIKR